jgi:glutamate dehydrogenase
MTEEVAALVLANNYQQTLAISLLRRRGLAAIAAARMRFMHGARGTGPARPRRGVPPK